MTGNCLRNYNSDSILLVVARCPGFEIETKEPWHSPKAFYLISTGLLSYLFLSKKMFHFRTFLDMFLFSCLGLSATREVVTCLHCPNHQGQDQPQQVMSGSPTQSPELPVEQLQKTIAKVDMPATYFCSNELGVCFCTQ